MARNAIKKYPGNFQDSERNYICFGFFMPSSGIFIFRTSGQIFQARNRKNPDILRFPTAFFAVYCTSVKQ